MRYCGITEQCVQSMFHDIPDSGASGGFPNPHQKPLGTLSRELHIYQLFPGPELDKLGEKFARHFESDLQLENITPFVNARPSASDKALIVPLMRWISRVFVAAGQQAYFGSSLTDIYPSMEDNFLEFDALGWQVLYQYPRIFSRHMHRARDKLVDALEEYFAKPPKERSDGAWFTTTEEREMRSLGISTRDIARMMLIVYWG